MDFLRRAVLQINSSGAIVMPEAQRETVQLFAGTTAAREICNTAPAPRAVQVAQIGGVSEHWGTDRLRALARAFDETAREVSTSSQLLRTRRDELASAHHQLDVLRVEGRAGTVSLEDLDAAEKAVRLAHEAVRDAESLQARGAERQAVARAMYDRELKAAQMAWMHARMSTHRPSLARLREVLIEVEDIIASLRPDAEVMASSLNCAPFSHLFGAIDEPRLERALAGLRELLPDAPTTPARKRREPAAARPQLPAVPPSPWPSPVA